MTTPFLCYSAARDHGRGTRTGMDPLDPITGLGWTGSTGLDLIYQTRSLDRPDPLVWITGLDRTGLTGLDQTGLDSSHWTGFDQPAQSGLLDRTELVPASRIRPSNARRRPEFPGSVNAPHRVLVSLLHQKTLQNHRPEPETRRTPETRTRGHNWTPLGLW